MNRELQRGVYLLSRFEDPTGLDVTGLFWLENVSVGVAHLCQGDFLEELFDLLLSRYGAGGLPSRVPPPGGDHGQRVQLPAEGEPLTNTTGALAEGKARKENML